MSKSYTLTVLADQFGLALNGDGETIIDGVGTLSNATPKQLGFVSNPSFKKELAGSRAGAVVLEQSMLEHSPCAALISNNAHADFARIASLFDKRPAAKPGVAPTAVVAEDVVLGDGSAVAANAVIEAGCQIGTGAEIGANSYIGAGSRIGAQCRIGNNVSIGHRVLIGKRVIIHPGAVIGADGFGLAFETDHWVKVPQLGSVRIGDDCEIGANSTIDRGAIEDTVLEQDVRIDNQVQIAHNVFIGAHTAIAGCVGIAGSTRIGRYCMLAGGSGLGGHIEIADRVTLKARAMITRSVTESGEYGGGIEAQPIADWQRNLARIRKLDEFIKRLIRLERTSKDAEDND